MIEDVSVCFNYPLYKVTSEGVVLSQSGRPLKSCKDKKGYHRVVLRRNGKSHSVLVHRLVAFQFLDEIEGKFYVNHLDGDKSNNKVSNLEWVTEKENIDHAKRTGLVPKGENHYGTKLSNEDVEFIRKNYIPRHKEFGGKPLSLRFGISTSHLSGIINNNKRGITNE